MSIPSGVYRVVFGGNLPNGEVWESGFWVAGGLPTSNSIANSTAELWYAQLTASDASGAMRLVLSISATSVSLEYVRVYAYPTGGPNATYVGEYTQHSAGTASGNALPNQCSIVVSLRTDESGRNRRGRMYMPPATATELTSGGEVTSGYVTTMIGGWATCFGDWNASGDNGVVSVVSQVGAGSHVPVTGLVVDSVVDTQRRRRNKSAATTTQTADVTTG